MKSIQKIFIHVISIKDSKVKYIKKIDSYYNRLTNVIRSISSPKSKEKLLYYKDPLLQDIIIFDDFLPNPIGTWRSTEIGFLLNSFKESSLICLMNFYNDKNNQFTSIKGYDEDLNLFKKKFKLNDRKNSVYSINQHNININTKLAYCLFFHNLRRIFPIITEYNLPFCFTLYPGGGLKLYDKECESFLLKIAQSDLFRGVIVTQKSVESYLINRLNFDKKKIKLVYGCTLNVDEFILNKERKYFPASKKTLDICFVAAKYTPNGFDKGFDVFCEAVAFLTKKYEFIHFHVVGGFSKDDLLYPIDENQIHFYGYKEFDWFGEFYASIDIILSPVRSNVLGLGAFDGFPTGAVIDAGLFGTVMITSDPTGDNVHANLINNEEIVLIESNSYSVINKIENLINNPEKIEKIGDQGRNKMRMLFAKKIQLTQRHQFITQCISNSL